MIGARFNPERLMPAATSALPSLAPRRGRTAARGAAVLACVLSTSWFGLALAQVNATQEYLARMDTDGSGRVSLDEYQAWMGYAFAQMDRNGDDRLTPDELPGGRGREISLVEHRQRLADAFQRQDTNRDGVLDARELAAPPQ